MTKESQETRTREEHSPPSYLSMERLKTKTLLNHHSMPLFQNKGAPSCIWGTAAPNILVSVNKRIAV